MATKVKLIADGVITPDQITLTTASTGTNTTAPATTAFVQQEISALVDSSPEALNTLNELAAALGDDANFSTTVTNNIATKAPLASPTFTGDATFDTDTLVVDATNNRVGIGTTSPNQLLHLDNSASSSDSASIRIISGTAGLARIMLGDTGYGSRGRFVYDNSDDSLQLWGADSTTSAERMRIDSSGNVGIGTSSPNSYSGQTALTINSTGVARLDLDIGDTIQGHLLAESGYTGLFAESGNSLRFGTGSERMRITSDGNLKFIGQTTNFESPGFTYHTNNFLYLRGGSAGLILADDSSINTIQIADGSSGFIKFETGDGTERMRIDSSGNVGIGTDSPSITNLSGSTSVKGLEIQNEGNDTSAGIRISGNNNTGVPGQSTNTEIIHKGDTFRTHWLHGGADAIVIDSTMDFHFSPDDSDFRIRGGAYGSLFDSNPNLNNNIRFHATVGMLYNTGRSDGQHHFEVQGAQKFLIAPTYIQQTHSSNGDGYTIRSVSNGSGDPGISLVRAGQCGFGLTLRNSTVDYVDFQLQNGGGTVFGQEGIFRIYENSQVNIGDMAGYNAGIGQQFTNTGGLYVTRSSSSSGNETFIVNNINSANSVGILQYRLNSSPQGQYLVGSSNGITFTGSSDYRYKTNVNTLATSSLDKITQLRLVSYNWNAESGMPVNEAQIGVIAHEMEDVFPELVEGEYDAVWTQEEVDAKGEAAEASVGDIKPQTVSLLNKDMMVHILKAIQEQQTIIDDLKSRIETLEG